ncbi:lipoate-protein ligase A [Caldisphaera lagunensis DSM 15908]|uniref:Lipoate-protein ligase A n=1 Tax=Caldisphaera lagunensis (strain DSM 15908 / JCM 11604 / ANMR 0165 / IC-154) TaxID=1056495 RepID=L0ABD6_CALLD|nr:biotin/lipoate A/B protein ligase family protein [Caldisphaera lagunensis]AFZ70734.1 lipoate-protein ligase A [Caldisphaera lagunensis DSM 15908]
MKLRVLMFETPHDGYYNIAFEEALARARGCNIIDDTLRFFRNKNAVIIGYFQKAEEEVNLDYLKKIDAQLIRRPTGGGAVYHDLGNLNYSIAVSYDKAKNMSPVDYIFSVLIKGPINALNSLGFDARLENINDIVVNNRKVSGTAASTSWNTLFFHGAMLLNTDMEKLSSVLKISQKKLIDKGVSSVKYRVTNLFDINNKIKIDDIINSFVNSYKQLLNYDDVYYSIPTKKEIEIASLIYEEKYTKYEWNYNRESHSVFQKLEEQIKELCQVISN